MVKYYKLLVGTYEGQVIMVKPEFDFDHFQYCFGTDKWVKTNIFIDFLWPWDDEFEQYVEIDEDKAYELIRKEKIALSSLLKLAEETAMEAHKHQTDIGGQPYVNHLEFVANNVDCLEHKITAWLHDIIEDTPINKRKLSMLGFPKRIVEAVEILTKKENQDYDEYLWHIKGNMIARKVKLADLKHNMDINRLGRKPQKRDLDRLEKYKQSIMYLENI